MNNKLSADEGTQSSETPAADTIETAASPQPAAQEVPRTSFAGDYDVGSETVGSITQVKTTGLHEPVIRGESDEAYESGKPRRKVIRAKIIHD